MSQLEVKSTMTVSPADVHIAACAFNWVCKAETVPLVHVTVHSAAWAEGAEIKTAATVVTTAAKLTMRALLLDCNWLVALMDELLM
jgi:hypothetical protein